MLTNLPRITRIQTGHKWQVGKVYSPAVDLLWRSQYAEMISASTVFFFSSSLHPFWVVFLLLLANLGGGAKIIHQQMNEKLPSSAVRLKLL